MTGQEGNAEIAGDRADAGGPGGALDPGGGGAPAGAGDRGAAGGEDLRLTEARNPRTRHIDRAGSREIVDLILTEDRAVVPAVRAEAAAIAELVDRVAARMGRGGRLFYVGAGTSGRLGVLDASECPPTFGTDPDRVQGIIAGGPPALTRSREGVEDDRSAGRRAVRDAEVGPDDFVLGIAASGVTPFVLAALEESADRGAGVGFLSCSQPPEAARRVADVLVTPLVGPEVIAGSTRMKAGTATKLVLNTLSTGVMIRLGKVFENLMVDLRAASAKLADRSLRIVREAGGVDRARARELLVAAGGRAKLAIAMARLDADRATAERLLDACGGFLAGALERFPRGGPFPGYAAYTEADAPAAVERLRERLARETDRVVAKARDVGRDEGAGGGRSGRGAAELLDRAVEFESGTLRPWICRVLEEERPDLGRRAGLGRPPAPGDAGEATGAGGGARSGDEAEGSAGGVEEGAVPARLAERLRRERAATLERLAPLERRDWAREATLDGERVTLFQLLSGVAGETAALAERLDDRVHPALVDAGDSPSRRSEGR